LRIIVLYSAPVRIPLTASDTKTLPYRYRHLKRNDAFRLLQLEPSPILDGEIKASIIETCWTEKPDFEALPYVWGAPIFSQTLHLPGGTHKVAENLASALCHLRHETRRRRLWIDAVWINQMDDAEKSHQVAMMRAIYKFASVVIVWLGNSTPETTTSWRALERIAAASKTFDKSYRCQRNGRFTQPPRFEISSLLGRKL
jgi:Heterokaryon incompatibility protein (HET)